jgi:hypothetical protein
LAPQKVASKNQNVLSEVAAACELMQWLAVYRKGTWLPGLAPLTRVPVQRYEAPLLVYTMRATERLAFAKASVGWETQATSSWHDCEAPTPPDLANLSPGEATRCEALSMRTRSDGAATPLGK